MTLVPIGDPPSRRARWCPSCAVWIETRRRRCHCGTAVVRPPFRSKKPRAGELRPGIVAEFADPRDDYDPTPVLAALRARLQEPTRP